MHKNGSALKCFVLLAAVSSCKSKSKTSESETSEIKTSEIKATSEAPTEVRELVDTLVKEYRKAGHEILDPLQVHLAETETVEDYFDRQQDLLFRKNYFESRLALFRALGISTLATAKDLRKFSISLLAERIVGYYDWNNHKMVLTPSEKGQLMGQEATLIHEIGHAVQGSRMSFDELLKETPSTTEGRGIFRCIIEGEAEALALQINLAREGKGLLDIRPANLDNGLGRIHSGEMAEAYRIGRAFAVERFQEGGWQEVIRTTKTIPASSEQIIHPEKWQKDTPSKIEIPKGLITTDVELIYSDVIGELGIYTQFLTMGLSTHEAYLGGTGWEADRLHVYRRGEEHSMLWLTRWDRPLDAKQFADAMRSSSNLVVLHDAQNPLLVVLSHNLELDPSELPTGFLEDPKDAESTAAAETSWTATNLTNAFVSNNSWKHPRLDLSIPVPKGWLPTEVRGMQVLMAPNASPQNFTNNITVVEDPNLLAFSLARTSEELTKFTDGVPELDQQENQLATLDGRPVIRFHLSGKFPGAQSRAEALGISYLVGGKIITVTLTVGSEGWKEFEGQARTILSGVHIGADSTK